MNIEFRELNEPTPPPRTAKAIVIGGVTMGEVKPVMLDDEASWHAVIHLLRPSWFAASFLVQGYGPTPERACADAVAEGRRYRDAFAASLADLEQAMGTTDKTTEELEGQP